MNSPKTMWNKFRNHDYAHAYFDEFLNTYIATQIKTVREQRGYSQEKLAELAGMKQTRISLLENVNYSSWSVNTLRRIARALGLRLKVSLETFSSGLPEVRTFTSENLRRKSLEEELKDREHIYEQALTDGLAVAAGPTDQVRPTVSVERFATEQAKTAVSVERFASTSDTKDGEAPPTILPGFFRNRPGQGAGADVGGRV